MSTKRQARGLLRGLRDAQPSLCRRDFSDIICQTTSRLLAVRRPRVVALYSAIGSEVDTTPLDHALRAMGVVVVYPRMKGDVRCGTLEFIAGDLNALVLGDFGILEPPGAELVALEAIDAIVLPGLGFDWQGHRLGYGGGYYDRSLGLHQGGYTGLCIGVAYSCQMVMELPVRAHDRSMDIVVTELGVLIPARATGTAGLL